MEREEREARGPSGGVRELARDRREIAHQLEPPVFRPLVGDGELQREVGVGLQDARRRHLRAERRQRGGLDALRAGGGDLVAQLVQLAVEGLLLRVAAGWRGRKAAIGTMLGFLSTMIVLVGYMLRGSEGFG